MADIATPTTIPTVTPPTPKGIDFTKSPTETVDQYNTRISAARADQSNPASPNYNPATNYNIPKQGTPPAPTAPAYGVNPVTNVPYGGPSSNNPNPNPSIYTPSNAPSEGTGNPIGSSQYTGNLNTDALIKAQNDQAAAAKTFGDAVTGITNGTIPLSSGDQAQVDYLKTQFDQIISQQNLQNAGASGTANIRGYQTGAAEYDPNFQARTIGSVMAAGTQKVANLQAQEASAVSALTQSLRNNDIAGMKTAYDAYTAANTATQDALKTTIAATQGALNDAHIAQVMASGVTNPKDILSTLQSQGYTAITSTDIANTIKNLSPDAANIFEIQKAAAANGAPQSVLAAIGASTDQTSAMTAAGIYNTTLIPDLQKLAEQNGAPQSVIQAIGSSTDSSTALQAAAGYTQTASGTLGDYLEYQRQAIAAGQVPEDYQTYEKAQQEQTSATAIHQAVTIADQEAAYKAQVDAANGTLTAQQSTRVNDVASQLNTNKDVQAFMSIAGQIGVLNSIPDGTQDPAQQSALLASVAHILSPNSSSLRGALNAIDPNSLDSGVYNQLKNIASIFSTVGKLSPDAVNTLKTIGTNEYNAYLTTYQSIRSAAVAPLSSQGIDVNSYIPDYSNINGSISSTLQAQSDQAAGLISNFGSQSANNAAILKQLASTMPNATTIEIAQTLGLIPATQ